MNDARALPWTDLVTALGEERFEEIRRALAEEKTDETDRDAFVLNRAAGAALREMVPEEVVAEAVNAYGTLLHMVYCAWRGLITYRHLPPRAIWAQPEPDTPHEPIDGAFVLERRGRVRVLAVLGFRAGADGFTTIEAEAALPLTEPGARPDGRPAFTSVLPGGEKLQSVTSNEELLWLALNVSTSQSLDA